MIFGNRERAAIRLTMRVAVVCLLAASPLFAQTRIAFTAKTDPSGFVDAEQKNLMEVATQLAKDFTKRAKQDHVVVVEHEADVTITVLHRNNRVGGLAGVYARGFAGQPTEVELRAGSYTTMIDERNTPLVAKRIRQWLKDNQQTLGKEAVRPPIP